MNEPELTVVEDHGSWLLMSDGNVITYSPGAPLWGKYAGQTAQAPKKQPSGRPTVDRREFDEMTSEKKWEVVRAGVRIVDPGEDEARAKAARAAAEAAAYASRGVTIKREAFERMPHQERHRVIAEGARIVD